MRDNSLPPPVVPARADRMIALCLLGLVLFNPPLVRVFGVERAVFGLPLIFVYLFASWALIIGLMVWFSDPPRAGRTQAARITRTD